MQKLPSILLSVGIAVGIAPSIAVGQSTPPADASLAEAWSWPTMPPSLAVPAGTDTIENALLRIVPAPYKITLDRRVPASAVLVWGAGDNWFLVLEKALLPLGLDAEADWAHNTVTIRGPNSGRSMPVRPSSTASSMNHSAETKGAAELAASSASSTPHSNALPKVSVSPVVLPLEVVGDRFTVEAGQRLSASLAEYAETFDWTLRWETATDYPVDASFSIPAMTLADAMEFIFDTYQSQGGLTRDTYTLAVPNRIVVVHPTSAKEKY